MCSRYCFHWISSASASSIFAARTHSRQKTMTMMMSKLPQKPHDICIHLPFFFANCLSFFLSTLACSIFCDLFSRLSNFDHHCGHCNIVNMAMIISIINTNTTRSAGDNGNIIIVFTYAFFLQCSIRNDITSSFVTKRFFRCLIFKMSSLYFTLYLSNSSFVFVRMLNCVLSILVPLSNYTTYISLCYI